MKSKILSFLFGAFLISGILFFTAAKGTNVKSKVGYINTNELWALMPEKKGADDELNKIRDQYITYLEQKQKQFEQEVMQFQADSSSMTPFIKQQRYDDLLKKQKEIQNFPNQAEEDLQKKQKELYTPIKEKMQKAIDEVAAENSYDYILDAAFGNIVFTKNTEDNILSLVKKKLGLE